VAGATAQLLADLLGYRALAAERPSALVFEDLHWADPSLLDLLEVLASRIRGQPVLLLALARPELLNRLPGQRQAGLAYMGRVWCRRRGDGY
jgi:hypothetical protein